MKNIAILFPGGGTQYVGMGKLMYDQYPMVRELFEEANDTMQYNLKKVCFEGDLDKLSRMNNSQPAIFIVSVAAYEVFKKETGVTPVFACGHSLGEYTALTCSGALKFGDALQMVKKRGALLQAAGNRYDATMMAINKVSSAIVEEECNRLNSNGGQVYVAVYNSEKQHVVSGARKDLGKLSDQLLKRGGDPVILNINTPSHCPLMADAAAEFRAELQRFSYSGFSFPVVSNVTGLPYNEQDNIFEMLIDHMVKPVRWQSTISYLTNNGVKYAVDMGPQAVLKNLIPFISNSITAFSLEVAEDKDAMKHAFSTRNDSVKDVIRECIRIAVSTKNYSNDKLAYEEGVVKPFARLRHLQESIIAEAERLQYAGEAVQLLTSILEAKQTPMPDKDNYLSAVRF